MKLYLDSALYNEIDSVIDSDAIGGVTTNPSLIAKTEKSNYVDYIYKLAERIGESGSKRKHLSVEVLSTEIDEMYNEAMTFHNMFRTVKLVDLFVKIPMKLEYMQLVSELNKDNINVNVTACMTAAQAIIGYCAGGKAISFFYNRMKDGGLDQNAEISEFYKLAERHIKQENALGKFVDSAFTIAGSIRCPADVINCWNSGIYAVTAPLKIIELMTKHEQTDKAINRFNEDIKKWQE